MYIQTIFRVLTGLLRGDQPSHLTTQHQARGGYGYRYSDPTRPEYVAQDRVLALQLIRAIFETAGPTIGSFPTLVQVGLGLSITPHKPLRYTSVIQPCLSFFYPCNTLCVLCMCVCGYVWTRIGHPRGPVSSGAPVRAHQGSHPVFSLTPPHLRPVCHGTTLTALLTHIIFIHMITLGTPITLVTLIALVR